MDGVHWNTMEPIVESGGLYRLTRDDHPVWVAWNDNDVEAEVTISGVDAADVLVADAVPAFESGLEVTDCGSSFAERSLVVTNGEVAIAVAGGGSLYVEPMAFNNEVEEGCSCNVSSNGGLAFVWLLFLLLALRKTTRPGGMVSASTVKEKGGRRHGDFEEYM